MSREEVRDNFFHDLRSPLARAQTFGKLLLGASVEEKDELLQALLRSLNELDAILRSEEERLG